MLFRAIKLRPQASVNRLRNNRRTTAQILGLSLFRRRPHEFRPTVVREIHHYPLPIDIVAPVLCICWGLRLDRHTAVGFIRSRPLVQMGTALPRNSKTSRCVHCLGLFAHDRLSRDHVIPDAWYPRSVPPRDRPVVPSCISCNQKLGKIERALGVRLGLCIDPNDPLAGDFAKKAARAVNPGFGANPKDATHRLGLRGLIIRDWMTVDEFPSSAVIPGFERIEGYDETELRAIGLEKAAVDAFGEKLVRGSSYLFSRIYIEAGHDITINLMSPDDNPYLDILDRFGRRIDVAPDISIRRAGDLPADPACGLFEFKFWDRLYIYGAVTPSSAG
jgi:hypothetical protein